MVKSEWGTKRSCTECGARFYDLNKNPIICSKCEAVVVIETPKSLRAEAKAKAKAKEEAEAEAAKAAEKKAADEKAGNTEDALLSEAGIPVEDDDDDDEDAADGLIAGDFDGDAKDEVSDVVDKPESSTSEGS